jgi:hypothetical protein
VNVGVKMATDRQDKLALRRLNRTICSVWFVGGNCLAVRNFCYVSARRTPIGFKVRLGNV